MWWFPDDRAMCYCINKCAVECTHRYVGPVGMWSPFLSKLVPLVFCVQHHFGIAGGQETTGLETTGLEGTGLEGTGLEGTGLEGTRLRGIKCNLVHGGGGRWSVN